MSLLPLLLAAGLASAPTVDAAGAPEALDVPDGICAPRLQLTQPGVCPDLGPGEYAEAYTAARVPSVVAELPLEPLARYDPVVSLTYARVTTPEAPLFASPADGLAGTVKDNLGAGFIFVNLVEAMQEGDQLFYKIRAGEYVRASDVSLVTPTNFQGLLFSEPPTYTFGWIVTNVRPSRMPGIPAPRQGPMFYRRTVVPIFAAQRLGEWNWYLIGPYQWVEQRAISKVNLNPPPEGLSGRWVQVDLYEQTLVAYEDNRLVYATLVSSGLDKWATVPGLFHVYAHYVAGRMRGAYEPDGSDYYYLESVPWIMYFDGNRALHGEYWHDRLGFKRSHGCVNLAPLDARWLYEWTSKGTPVWVYDPSGQTPADIEGGSAP